MSRPRKNLRLFVAAYPSPALAQAMLDLLDDATLPPYRCSPVEHLHLTLQFIGDTPAARLDETLEGVARATGGLGPGTLAPRELIVLPTRGPARLVALILEASASLLELQRRLATRFARSVRARPGDRYLPHMTLCRFRGPTPRTELDVRVDLDAFEVNTVHVMRSTLQPSGAEHVELAAYDLNGAHRSR